MSFWKQFLEAGSITNILARSDAALVSTSLTLLPIIIDAANVVNPRCNAVIWKHGFSLASLICTTRLFVHRSFVIMPLWPRIYTPTRLGRHFFFRKINSSEARITLLFEVLKKEIFQVNCTYVVDIIY